MGNSSGDETRRSVKIDEASGPIAIQLQRVCRDTLPCIGSLARDAQFRFALLQLLACPRQAQPVRISNREAELGYLLLDFSCAVLLHSSAAKGWGGWRGTEEGATESFPGLQIPSVFSIG